MCYDASEHFSTDFLNKYNVVHCRHIFKMHFSRLLKMNFAFSLPSRHNRGDSAEASEKKQLPQRDGWTRNCVGTTQKSGTDLHHLHKRQRFRVWQQITAWLSSMSNSQSLVNEIILPQNWCSNDLRRILLGSRDRKLMEVWPSIHGELRCFSLRLITWPRSDHSVK